MNFLKDSFIALFISIIIYSILIVLFIISQLYSKYISNALNKGFIIDLIVIGGIWLFFMIRHKRIK